MRKTVIFALILLLITPFGHLRASSDLDLYINTNTTNPSGSPWNTIYVGTGDTSNIRLDFNSLSLTWEVDNGIIIGSNSLSTNNQVIVEAGTFNINGNNSNSCVVGYASDGNLLEIGPAIVVGTAGVLVGNNGTSKNSLILNEAVWNQTNGSIIVGSSAHDNSMIVENYATLLLYSSLIVGDGGSNNTLTISYASIDAAGNSAGTITIGNGAGGDNNTLSLDSATPSGISLANSLYLGNNGANNNKIFASNYSIVTVQDLYIGNGGGTNNTVVASGESTINATNGVYINGVNNKITITTGAQLTAVDLGVGGDSSEESSSGNMLIFSNGGIGSISSNVVIGNGIGNNNNSIIVTGTNSKLTISGTLYSGFGTSNGSTIVNNNTTVSNGGTLIVNALIVGNSSGSVSNNVTVTGAGSSLVCSNDFIISYNLGALSNSFDLLDGAQATVRGNMIVGYGGTGNEATISGSTLTVGGNLILSYDGNQDDTEQNYLLFNSNSLVRVAGGIIIGSGNDNLCTISNSQVTASYFVLGNGGSGSNSAIIGGSNASLILTNSGSYSNSIIIGNSSPSNSLALSSGGTVYGGLCILGNNSSFNAITIAGSGSSLSLTNTNPYSFIIGNGGSGNTLILSNAGALISNSYTAIGMTSTSSNNTVIVTDNGRWNNNGNFYLGYTGGNNSLTISNGGQVFVTGFSGVTNYLSGTSYIGLSSSGNEATVTGSNAGTNSLWSNSGSLFVGNIGSNNILTISGGGIVSDAQSVTQETTSSHGVTTTNSTTNFAAYIGWASNYGSNSVVVSDANSLWTNNGDIAIGYAGYGNSLIIDSGATVIDTNAYLGYTTTGSNNYTIISGVWSNSGNVYLGVQGSANYVAVTNGGKIFAQSTYIGVSSFALSNTIMVDGTGSIYTNNGDFLLQNGNFNSLIISHGGSFFASNSYIQDGVNSKVIITDSNSVMSNIGVVVIGDTNTAGSMTLSNGGTVIANSGIFVTNGTISSWGTNFISNTAVTLAATGTNYAKLAASNGNLTIGGALNLGSNSRIGMQMGSGTITVSSLNNLGSGCVLDFTGTSLNNNSNVLISYSTSNLSASDYSAQGITGITFTTNASSVSGNIATNANLTITTSITQTNALSVSNITFSGNAITSYIQSNGMIAASSNAGTVTLNNYTTVVNNGTLSGSNLVVAKGSTLKGTGTNDFATTSISGTVAPGNSPGTLHFTGNVIFENGSTALIVLAGTNFDKYSHLTAAGTINIQPGSTLDLRPIDDGAGHGHVFNPEYGDIFTDIVVSEDGIVGGFSSIVTPTNARARLLYVINQDGSKVLSYTLPQLYNSLSADWAPSTYTLVAQNQNQTNAAIVLNTFIHSPIADEQFVSVSLDFLRPYQYPAAFNQIMPTLYQSLSTIAFNLDNANNMELIQRLWGARIAEGGFSMNGFGENMPLLEDPNTHYEKNDILSSGAQTPWGCFIDGSGIFAQANSGNMLPTYASESGGVTTGLTYKWNKHVVSGLYTGYQGGYTKYNSIPTGTLINNGVRFGLFGTYGQEPAKGFFVDGLIGGNYSGYTMQRNINFSILNRTATGNPESGELNAMLASGYDLTKGNWIYGPQMSLQYAYFGVNSFNETGAESLNLNNVSWNTSSMIYSLGSQVAYRWQVNKNFVVVPQINLNWQHEFLQNPYDISANLGGINFNNGSNAPLRDTLRAGTGFSLEFAQKWNASFFYNTTAGNNDIMSQNIFLSLGVRF